MKILVMGSGGVGGYFGGRLAAYGNDVTFVARGAHLEAMQEQGLQIRSRLGNLHVMPAKTTLNPAEVALPEIVLFTTKMADTEGAARQLKPVMNEGVTLITFQNGVDGPDMIRRVLPGMHVVPGVARIGSHVARPGLIEHISPYAQIEFGEATGGITPKLEAFHSVCERAGIDAVLSNDITRNVWMKFAMLASFSGMAALTGQTSGPLRTNPSTRALIVAAIHEAIAVGQAAGGWLRADDFPALMKAIHAQPPNMTSSMAHDRKAGKPLEVDYLSGALVRIGKAHGVPAPTHQFIADALAAG